VNEEGTDERTRRTRRIEKRQTDERTMHEKARHSSSIVVYRTIVMRRLAAPLSYNSLADEEDVAVAK